MKTHRDLKSVATIDAAARPTGFVGRRPGDRGIRWLKHQNRFEMAHVFEQMSDPYLAARAEDVRNIGRQDLQCNRPA
jgi:hypothetical protein